LLPALAGGGFARGVAKGRVVQRWAAGMLGLAGTVAMALETGVDSVLANHLPPAAHGPILERLEADGVSWLRERSSWTETLALEGAQSDLRPAWQVFRERGFKVLAFTRGVRRWQEDSLATVDLATDLREVYRRAAWMAYTHADAVDAWELLNEGENWFVKDMPDRATAWEKAVYLGLKSGAAEAGGRRQAAGGEEAGGEEVAARRQAAGGGGDFRTSPPSHLPTQAQRSPPSHLPTQAQRSPQHPDTPAPQHFSAFIASPFEPAQLDAVPVLLGAIAGRPEIAYYRVKAQNGFADYADAWNFHHYGWVENLDELIAAHRWFMSDVRTSGRQDVRTSGASEVGSPRAARAAEVRTSGGQEVRSPQAAEVQMSGGQEVRMSGGSDIHAPRDNSRTPRAAEVGTSGGQEVWRSKSGAAEDGGAPRAESPHAAEVRTSGGQEVRRSGGSDIHTPSANIRTPLPSPASAPISVNQRSPTSPLPSPNSHLLSSGPYPLWLTEINRFRGEVAVRGGEAVWAEQAAFFTRAVELAAEGEVAVIMPFILYRRENRNSLNLLSEDFEPLPPWEAYVGAMRREVGPPQAAEVRRSRGQDAASGGGQDVRSPQAAEVRTSGRQEVRTSGGSEADAFHLPTPNSELPSPISQLPTPISPLPSPISHLPSPIVLQWIADPVTAAANKPNGAYRFLPAADPGRGWRPVEGELRVYNFGAETAEGVLEWEVEGPIEALVWEEGIASRSQAAGGMRQADQGGPGRMELSVPSMEMRSFRLRLIAEGPQDRYFRGSFRAEFYPPQAAEVRSPQAAEVRTSGGQEVRSPQAAEVGKSGRQDVRRSGGSEEPSPNSHLPSPISHLPSPAPPSLLYFPLEATPDWGMLEALPVVLETEATAHFRYAPLSAASRPAHPPQPAGETPALPGALRQSRPNSHLPTPVSQLRATGAPPLPRWIASDHDPELRLYQELLESWHQGVVSNPNPRPLIPHSLPPATRRLPTAPTAPRLAPCAVTSRGRLDFHHRDHPYGYEWTSQSGVWSGVNGVRVEARPVQAEKYPTLRLELPATHPHSQKRPMAVARVVGGLPEDGWLTLLSSRPFDSGFNVLVQLIDRWGQRWWVDEQLTTNPHRHGRTKLLNLRDFDPTYFGNVLPGAHFDPRHIVEIQLELQGAAGRGAFELVLGVGVPPPPAE
jgi:hypothetical protein